MVGNVTGAVGRRRALGVLGGMALVGSLLAAVPVAAAPAQQPPPTVTVSGFDGQRTELTDCDGVTNTTFVAASFSVARAGDGTDPLAIDVSYDGEPASAPTLGLLPDPILLPPGVTEVQVTVPEELARLTVALEADASYAVGSPSSVVVQVVHVVTAPSCQPPPVVPTTAPPGRPGGGGDGAPVAATPIERLPSYTG